jgi:putative transposase
MSVLAVVFGLLSDLITWVGLTLRSQRLKDAEILFLRRQLGLYVERGIKPRRIGVATASQLIAFLAMV